MSDAICACLKAIGHILAWLTAIVILIGESIYEWCYGCRDPNCDEDPLCNGEARNGWKMVVHIKSCEPTPAEERPFAFLHWSPPPQSVGDVESGYNLPFEYEQESQCMLHYCRVSQISESISATLFKAVYDTGQWDLGCFCYVGRRSVIAWFARVQDPGVYRLLISDAFVRRRPRMVDIRAPTPSATLLWAYYDERPRPRLRVLFEDFDDDLEQEGWRYEQHFASYMLDQLRKDRRNPVSPASWESISIPVLEDQSQTYIGWVNDAHVLMINYYNGDLATPEHSRCLTFNATELWRWYDYPTWRSEVEQPILDECSLTQHFPRAG